MAEGHTTRCKRPGSVPMTPTVQKVLRLAREFARQSADNYVRISHVEKAMAYINGKT
jgi:hypothetical protein